MTVQFTIADDPEIQPGETIICGHTHCKLKHTAELLEYVQDGDGPIYARVQYDDRNFDEILALDKLVRA